MKKVNVSSNYQCPLCTNHKDDVFYNSKIVDKPICEGCSIELSHFVEEDERPDDFLLDSLEKLTGLHFNEYKRLGLEETLEEFQRKLLPENIKDETSLEMKITGRSFDEVVNHWNNMVEYYQNEINKLTKNE
jgi:hypothetical protein